MALGSFLSGKQELHRRSIATKRRQARVALTASILTQLRSIQMMGLGPSLAVQLDHQRKAEVGALLEERGSRMREFSLCKFLSTRIDGRSRILWLMGLLSSGFQSLNGPGIGHCRLFVSDEAVAIFRGG